MFSRVTNKLDHLVDKSGFGSCHENGTCLTVLCQELRVVDGGLWCGDVFLQLSLTP